MEFTVQRTTPAAPIDVATLDETKRHLLLDHSAQDVDLPGYILMAQKAIEGETNVGLGKGEFVQKMPGFPSGALPLMMTPIDESVSVVVEYLDEDRALQTLDAAEYWLNSYPYVAQLEAVNGWPTSDGVQVTFTAGKGYCDLDPALRHAMLVLVAYFYQNRGDASAGNYPAEYQRLINSVQRPIFYNGYHA